MSSVAMPAGATAKRSRLGLSGLGRVAVLTLVCLVTLAPFAVMLSVSFASPGALYDGALLPMPSLDAAIRNYGDALTQAPILRYMLNGVVVCGAIVVLQVLVAAPAGYALAKLRFVGRPFLFALVIVSLMIPMQVPAIPLYVGIAYAGLLDSYTALILPFIVSAFGIFLFRQFFLTYPDEILDAARLDGFSEFSIVWRLMVPAAWPAVTAFAVISTIIHWNDLYWPLVVVTRTEMMTPPLGLLSFRASAETGGNVNALMAGGVMITAPLVILFIVLQRQLVRGLSVGIRR